MSRANDDTVAVILVARSLPGSIDRRSFWPSAKQGSLLDSGLLSAIMQVDKELILHRHRHMDK
jgi:hypothetical protein